MSTWLVVLFNILILLSWVYLIYLVYNLDPKIQAEWKGSRPAWGDEYTSFINSIKATSFINGSLVILTIGTAIYSSYTTPQVAGRRR